MGWQDLLGAMLEVYICKIEHELGGIVILASLLVFGAIFTQFELNKSWEEIERNPVILATLLVTKTLKYRQRQAHGGPLMLQ